MNQRILSIIQELRQLDREYSIGSLAKQFQVSERTIRNDLKAINGILAENGLPEVEIRKGGQIGRDESFPDVLGAVSAVDYYDYKLSKEERKRIAAALLVSASGFLTLSSIADSLFVSRATVINDLGGVKAFIRTGNLEVTSHPNKGLRVEGRESDKRLFLMNLIQPKLGAEEQNVISSHISVEAGNRVVIQKIVSEQEYVYDSFLTDASFRKVIHYLGIMVNRSLQGEYISHDSLAEENFCKMHDGDRFLMAQDILKYVSQYCGIRATEDEVHFFGDILSRQKYIRKAGYAKNAVKVQLVTRRFIEAVSEEIGVNLNGDYDFFENLSNHLESVFAPEPPADQTNPLIEEVLEEHRDILQAVEKKLPILTAFTTRKINDYEIGYIAIHICAALERKKNKEIAFHVIVACHAGIGTSQLLLEKLKKHFNFQIVDVISAHEAKSLIGSNADFIISTVPLSGCKLDHVVVSPMLSDEDYIRVGNKIDTLRNSRHLPSRTGEDELSAKGLLEKIKPVVYESVPEKAPELYRRLRRVVRDYFNQGAEADAEIFSPYHHHLLPESHIQLDVPCADWREAVRRSAEPLQELGYIEERYIDAMIKNIEENGPYIVLSKGFAVPHEGLEQGSIKVGMNLIRLKTPVSFGAEELDPVEFVCCLSAVDHKTHLKAFFHLVNMLGKETFKEKLRNCRTPREMAAVIEQEEYEL